MTETESLRAALAARDAALAVIAAKIEPLIAEVAALRKRREVTPPAPAAHAPPEVVKAAHDRARELENLTTEAFAKADRLASAVVDLRTVAAKRGLR